MPPQRGDVYWAEIKQNETVGSEQYGYRPLSLILGMKGTEMEITIYHYVALGVLFVTHHLVDYLKELKLAAKREVSKVEGAAKEELASTEHSLRETIASSEEWVKSEFTRLEKRLSVLETSAVNTEKKL